MDASYVEYNTIVSDLYRHINNWQEYYKVKERNTPADVIMLDEDGYKHRLVRNEAWWMELVESEVGQMLDFKFVLPRMPHSIITISKAYFLEDLSKEAVVEVWWDKYARTYVMTYPDVINVSKDSVEYKPGRLGLDKDFFPVITIHSHNTMPAAFSQTDDENERFGLYGVIGELAYDNDSYATCFRAGLAGAFKELSIYNLFQ